MDVPSGTVTVCSLDDFIQHKMLFMWARQDAFGRKMSTLTPNGGIKPDFENCTITFEQTVTFRMQVLGTASIETNSWMNAHSHPSFESEDKKKCTNGSKTLKEIGQQFNIPEFTNEGLKLNDTIEDAHILAMFGTYTLNADAYFSYVINAQGTRIYMALWSIVKQKEFDSEVVVNDIIEALISTTRNKLLINHFHSYVEAINTAGMKNVVVGAQTGTSSKPKFGLKVQNYIVTFSDDPNPMLDGIIPLDEQN